MSRTLIRGATVITMNPRREILPGASIAIEDGVIAHVGDAPDGDFDETIDADGQAALPGLVNAHTHLELSGLRGQLPAGRPMPQWLFALLAHRPRRAQLAAAVAEGAREALAGGTTAVGDISHNHSAWKTLKDLPLRKVCFAEVTGIGPLARKAIPRLTRRIAGLRGRGRLAFGICPHAPYSTAEEVYRQAVAIARKRHWPLATHLAETEAERQFLLRGSGRFFDFLAHLGLIDSSVGIHRCTPLAFARRVGLLDGPCVLAHVNYIDDEEFKLLASSRASVVYCPRSNAFFGRSGHRYAEMLAAGINVALGTDSLASNTSLEMLEEMRHVRAEGLVDNETILRMGTLNGARALGWEEKIGSLSVGKQADWIAVELPSATAQPLETIFTCPARVVETAIAGRTVFRAPVSAS